MTASHHTSLEYLPLTKGQLEHYEMLARFPEFRTPFWTSYRISRELNVAALADAIKSVVGHHEGMRIGIRELPGCPPVQWIRAPPPDRLLISRQEVRAVSRQQFEKYVRHVMARNQEENWSLSDGYPFKFLLLKYSSELHALIVGLSHLAMDARAKELVLRDLWRAYSATGGCIFKDGGQRMKSYSDAIRCHKVQGEEDEGKRGRRFIQLDVSQVFSVTQFLTIRSAPTSQYGFILEFGLNAILLADLRSMIHESEFSEAQCIFAALAHSVFGICPQDRIQFPITVDLRNAAERDLVGMFATSATVIVDRPRASTTVKDFLSHVKQRTIRAMVDCQRTEVRGPDLRDRDETSKWGSRQEKCLWFNYRNIASDQSGRTSEPANVERDAYSPSVRYTVRGISSDVISTPEHLRLRIAFNEAIFSMEAAEEFVANLQKTLAIMAEYGAADNRELAAPARSAPDHIATLADGQGNTVAWADMTCLAKHIGEYPGVISSTVRRVAGSAGETLLEAVVAVSEEFQFTETTFKEQLLKTAEPQRLLLAPHRILLSRDADLA
ncbi:condensation domain-containing protein [Nonomuraea sp. NPDC050643]|uniref:condensation domain-containing protein n=1 Tax=Nonomuraea sp. NPDC050643 TaxID=3155660 RepID=UPI0033FF731B